MLRMRLARKGMMVKEDNLTDADYTALADFRFALRQFLVFSERRAAEHGSTAVKWACPTCAGRIWTSATTERR